MNKKTKVLHISYGGLGNGGVASVIISIVENLADYFDFGCVTFPSGNERKHIVERYSKVYCINCYNKKGWRKVFELLCRPFVMYSGVKKICQSEHYDIIHCHIGFDMVYCLLAAKHAGVKKRIAHSHNTKSPQKPTLSKRLLIKIQRYFINRLATHRVGCSSLACEAMFEDFDARVIFNSVNLQDFPWERTAHKGLSIVNVGRFDFPKNQSFVIDIAKVLKEKGIDFNIRLVGFGHDEAMLKNKVAQLNLSSCVSFVDGRKADIHSEYAKADIMVFPTRYEGFGIVLLEAQASGCYCISSDVVPDETNVGLMKMLSLTLSAEQWAEKILDYWNKHIEHKPEEVQERLKQFCPKTIAQQYSDLYEE